MFRHQGRLHPDRNSGINVLDRCQEFNGVAHGVRRLKITKLHMPDTFHFHIIHTSGKSVRQRGENDSLVGSIPSVDIQTWLSFRVPRGLGLRQNRLQGKTFSRHPGEDVITGSVKNSVHATNMVSNQPLTQAADNRDATSHTGLKIQVHTMGFSLRENLLPAFRQQRLVCRDHGFSFPEGS